MYVGTVSRRVGFDLLSFKAGAKKTRSRKAKAPAWHFWHPPTLEQLIEEQGIKPLTKEAMESADFWPEDQDVEEFLKLAMGDRYRR